MSQQFARDDLAVIAQQFTDDYGLENVDPKIKTIAALIEKYRVLTLGMENDADALAKLYWDEIMSKVDLTTYGRN